MEYAMQMLLPILAGLWLGTWLTQQYHVSPLWTPGLAILGLALGVGVLAKKSLMNRDGSPTMPRYEAKPGQSLLPTPRKSTEKETGLKPHELEFLYRHNDTPHDDPPLEDHPYRDD
jgi:hypothetical protein